MSRPGPPSSGPPSTERRSTEPPSTEPPSKEPPSTEPPGPVTEPPDSELARTLPRWARSVLGAVGLVGIFLGATVAGTVLHLNLPAPRRAAALLVSSALSDLFEGRIEVGSFEQLGPIRLEMRDIRVFDPEGTLVITADRVRAGYLATRILREYLFGGPSWQLVIDYARVDGAWARVLPGPDDVPTLVRAFEVRPSPSPSPRPPSREVTVALPIIELGDLRAQGEFAEAPPLHAEIRSARGSLLVTPELTTLDFERFGLHASGLEDWEADGLGSLHVRAPGPIWAHFDGEIGDVPVHLFGKLDGDRVEARAELPRIDPAAARAAWPEWPLETSASVRIVAEGQLPELEAEITAQLGNGTIAAKGLLTLEDGLTADIDLDTKDLDLSLVSSSLPSTAIESRGALMLWSDGARWTAELNGTVQPSEWDGFAVPAVDFRGTYDADGLELSATFHEQGVPAHIDALMTPEGVIRFQASLGRARFENSPRLTAWLGARGTFEAELTGTIDGDSVQGQLDLRTTQVLWGDLGAGSARVTANAQGKLSDLSALRWSGQLRSTDARVGTLRLAQLEARSSGGLEHFDVELRANHDDGTTVRGRAQVEPTPLALRDATLSVTRNGVETAARVRRATLAGREVRLEGARVESGGYLEGDASWGPGRIFFDAQGRDLDLGRVAEALGLPRNQLDGKLTVHGKLTLGEQSRGRVSVALQNGTFWMVRGLGAQGTVEFDGRVSRGMVSAELPGLVTASARWDGRLAGHPTRPESWADGTGQVELAFERIQLSALAQGLRSPLIESAGGEVYVRLNLARTAPGRLPQALFLAGSQGLLLELPAAAGEPPRVLDSVDWNVAGAVDGESGKLAATGRLFDGRGDLMTLSAELETDLQSLASALLQGHSPWPLVAHRPVRAVAIVPYRNVEHLPSLLRPAGYSGRGGARAVIAGTLAEPDVNVTVTAHQVSGRGSPFLLPVDGEGTLRYSVGTGKLQGSLRASQNTVPIARGTFDLQVPWQHVIDAPVTADTPLWTGNAQLVLDGMPLELLNPLAERQVRGSIQGSVVVSRKSWIPHVRADMTLRRLEIADAHMGEGRLIADTSEDAILVRSHFEDEFGSLTASARAGIVATAGALTFVEESPLRFTIESRQYDAKVISPFVRDVFPELSGTLNGVLQATLEPPPKRPPGKSSTLPDEPWQAHLSGRMSLTGGTIEPVGLGLRLQDTTLVLEAKREGEYNVLSLDDIRARANSERENFQANGRIYLRNLDIEHARFEVKQQAVPLSTGGARLADLTGTARAVVERQEGEMLVDVDIPRMTAELPPQSERPLIELEDNPSITVKQAVGPPEEEPDPDSSGTPWRIRFRLGDDVRVRSRQVNLQVRGSPELRLAEEVRMAGTIELVPGGRVTVLGRTFVIEQGRITFDTDEASNPHLDITAAWRAPNGVLVLANVQGTAKEPTLSWGSDPGLPGGEAEVIALVLGASGGESRDASAGFAGALVNEVLGQAGPRNVQLSVSQDTGTGEGQVARMSQRTWDAVTATVQISDQVWIEGSYLRPRDTAGAINAQNPGVAGALDWRFHPDWSLRTEAGNLGTGVDLLWRYRY